MNNKKNIQSHTKMARLIVWSIFFAVIIGMWCFSTGRELLKKEDVRIEINQ